MPLRLTYQPEWVSVATWRYKRVQASTGFIEVYSQRIYQPSPLLDSKTPPQISLGGVFSYTTINRLLLQLKAFQYLFLL